jgi:hypothetical protein
VTPLETDTTEALTALATDSYRQGGIDALESLIEALPNMIGLHPAFTAEFGATAAEMLRGSLDLWKAST